MFSLREYRKPRGRLPDYLPWCALVAPGVVLQKDGLLQKTVRYRGADLDAAEDHTLEHCGLQLNGFLKRLGTGWTYFVEVQRREVGEYPSTQWDHPGPWLIDLEQRELFMRGTQFHMEYYLTFVWNPSADVLQHAKSWFFGSSEDQETPAEESVTDFIKKIDELLGLLRSIMIEVEPLSDEETLGYLHSTISMNNHPVAVPEIPFYLDALLPDMPLSPGAMPMLGEHHLSISTITGFPNETFPEILQGLQQVGVEYRWVNRFILLGREDAEKLLEQYRQRFFANRKRLSRLLKEEIAKEETPLMDNRAIHGLEDTESALREVAQGSVSFGYYTGVLVTWDKDKQKAREKGRLLRTVVQERGFSVIEETFHSREAWFSSIPGHVYANIRRPLIHTLNVAHIIPYTASWEGDSSSGHLKKISGVGTPHLICPTKSGVPFSLNLGVGDVGHTFIAGPTGAGKSTLLSLIGLQWLKYPRSKVYIFDKDCSALSATTVVGGRFYEPGGDEEKIPFQPLAKIDNERELLWADTFIAELCEVQGCSIGAKEREEIHYALSELSEAHRGHRTISALCGLIQNKTLRRALEVYSLDGPFGRIFDGDSESLVLDRWVMLEMGVLMELGDSVVIPALRYLFHRLEEVFTGDPVLLVLDEAWLFLQHKIFQGQIRGWLKTLRKKRVYVIFATQELSDASQSDIMPTILSACHSKIYLPDEEAQAEGMAELYRSFGLGEREISIIAHAQGKCDYYYASARGRRLFSLPLGGVTLALIDCKDRKLLTDILGVSEESYSEKPLMKFLATLGIEGAIHLIEEAKREGGNIYTT